MLDGISGYAPWQWRLKALEEVGVRVGKY